MTATEKQIRVTRKKDHRYREKRKRFGGQTRKNGLERLNAGHVYAAIVDGTNCFQTHVVNNPLREVLKPLRAIREWRNRCARLGEKEKAQGKDR